MAVEIRDVAPGLWLWRQRHHDWKPGDDWEPVVSCFVVEAGGEVVLFDPLAPPPGERALWDRLDTQPPTRVVVVKPDHVRDVDLFVRWFGVPGHGPWLYWRGDVPRTELEALRPDDELPGGLLALHDGRFNQETPIYARDQRAIIFADGMTSLGGELRVWWTPLLERRTLPALRAMLDLPFERVLVSHGEPVHTRADFEAALEREPWATPTDADA